MSTTNGEPQSILDGRARRMRLVAAGVVLLVLLAGTFWGQDDHFPFGPFRMYSTTNDPSGEITRIAFRATTEDGQVMFVRSGSFGMRPAEVDGQIARFRADPPLLAHLVESYERFNPDAPRLTEFEIVQRVHQLENGRPVGYSERVVAAWQR